MAAVVGHEDNEGVAIQAAFAEEVEHAPEGVVHAFEEHGAIALDVRPWQPVVGVGVLAVFCGGGVVGARFVPSVGIAEGRVDGVVGEVEVEGLAGGGLEVAVDGLEAFVREGVGEEDVVVVVVAFVEPRHPPFLGVEFVHDAVFVVTAGARRPADLASGDVHVEAEGSGVGAGGGAALAGFLVVGGGSPVGFSAMDGVVAGFLEEGGEPFGVGEGARHAVGQGGVAGGRLAITLLGRPQPRRTAGAFGLGAGGLHPIHRPCGRVERLKAIEAVVRGIDVERPVGDAVARRVHATHQRASRGGANGVCVGVGEEHSFVRHALHVRGVVAAVQAGDHRLAVFPTEGKRGVLPAHVVHKEQHNVGAFPFGRGLRAPHGRRGQTSQSRAQRGHERAT